MHIYQPTLGTLPISYCYCCMRAGVRTCLLLVRVSVVHFEKTSTALAYLAAHLRTYQSLRTLPIVINIYFSQILFGVGIT